MPQCASARLASGWRTRVAGAASAAPRGRDSGRERVVSVLSFNGRPGTRQGNQTPHRGAVLPVDAYSLAVACGGRGVSLSTSGPPAFRHPPRRASSVSRTRQGPLPVPHDTSRHDLVPATPVCPAGTVSPRLGGPPAVGGTLPLRALPRSWRTVPLRCVDRLCCCFAARHWCSSRCCYHTPGSSSRQRRLWRPVCAGHLSTASSRGHQQSC